MFRGITNLNLDAKGRLAMPTRHREAFAQDDNQLILTIDTQEHCLLIYPLATWLEIEKQIDALPSFNKTANRIKRMLIGHATQVEFDSAGRIVIPPALRAHAKLEKPAVLVGQGKKLELWSQPLWSQMTEEFLDQSDEDDQLPTALETLSL
ncbi:division/cell wall cluster transcriptional repressor MraZ [Guyparkeria halophila]|uniref:Transcriptional regulator MraZ n=1 Tax=Guyparkeria halophila TaxID=47960 RepID=A0A6I6CXD2_9GAMM|nr:division/cell wall cluster transcriptional repressor MraZ [Guyparkeria halophila]QGT79056.1 division/cell wall cluster transcriptional repressor MraZ [Guyparkeria halophila]